MSNSNDFSENHFEKNNDKLNSLKLLSIQTIDGLLKKDNEQDNEQGHWIILKYKMNKHNEL